MPRLALSLLGTFQATLNGEPITTFESNKVRALLAFLAVESDRPHARETLAGLLWPDFPNRDALRNLRLALSNLRQAIDDHRADPPLLFITRETIQFNAASDYTLDLTGLGNRSGLGTNRGKFLDGFSCDSASFEEWLLHTREQIGQQVLRALRALTARAEERGEYDRAQTFARQQLEIEPWDEQAHQSLMRALAYGGQRSAALAQYENCRRLLEQELGVEPSRETTMLYEGIRDGKLARAKTAARDNLPIPLTSFVGRENEIAEVKRLLTTARLLTLTGAGGCGKTRLALQIARDLRGLQDREGLAFPDGVWFIDLAPLADPALVLQVIASVFNLHQVSDTPINVLLQNFLRAKNLLLVLDNCEHLIQACAQLCDDLLRACPDLKILATSREALNIAGETALRVPSLSLPDLQKSPTTETLKQSESVCLFIERARAARSDFQSSDASTRAIAQACQRLDGIPLAIELAAARVNAISVEEIAARLDDRFRLLTSGSRTALPRYQTLRASMDWSYDLLSDAERALFWRLAVFVGEFTLDAVEAACAEENKSEMLDLLSQLVQKSLVVSEQSGKSRYHLLETIREYALTKLGEASETDLYRARHLDYFLKLAEEAAPHFREPGEEVWVNALQMEHDNLLAAFGWAQESGKDETILRLVSALSLFWWIRGYAYEARECLTFALGSPSAHEPRLAHLRARALFGASRLARAQSDYVVANPSARECLALYRTLGDKRGIADALLEVGLGAWEQGNYVSAHSSLLEFLAIWKELESIRGIANAFRYLGITEHELGNFAEGRRLLEESVKMHRDLGFKRGIAQSLMHLGSIAVAQGDPAASSILEEGLTLLQQMGDEHDVGRCLHDLGQAAAYQADYELARTRFEKSLALLTKEGDGRNAIKCVEGLAGIAVAHGQTEQAARLFGASEAVREKLGTPLPASYRANYERTIAALSAQVDEEQMEKWWKEGRAVTFEQAIECALEWSQTFEVSETSKVS